LGLGNVQIFKPLNLPTVPIPITSTITNFDFNYDYESRARTINHQQPTINDQQSVNLRTIQSMNMSDAISF